MAVLLTRPIEDSRRLAEDLEAEGVACLLWPLTRIVPLVTRLDLPPGMDAVIFTSAHGARAFAGLSPRRDLPVFAVGDRTAEVARALGFGLVLSAGRDAATLAVLAQGSGLRRFLHARGRDAAGDLKGALARNGQSVTEAVLYAAEPAGPPRADVAHALASGAVDLVTVWSPRNARLLAERLPALAPRLDGMTALAISEAAAAPLAGLGFGRIEVAEHPDGAAMRAAILALSAPAG